MSSAIPCCCRLAAPSDLDAVAALWHESARLGDGAPRDMPSRLELRQRVDAELASGWRLWVAARDRSIFGMLAIRKRNAVLDQLYVLPAVQRCGIGRLLIEHAMHEMPSGFTLRTAAANTRARAFYAKAGLRLLFIDQHPRHGYSVCNYGWQPLGAQRE